MNDEKWILLGTTCKQIHQKLQEALVMSNGIVTLECANNLLQASKYLDRFRSKAEGEMFSHQGPQHFNVFYGKGEK